MPAKTSFPKNKIKIALMENIHPAGIAMLKDEGFSVEALTASPDPAKLAKLIKDAHLIGIRSKTELTKEVLAGAERLLGVGCFCIGTNQVDITHACSLGVPVFNSPFSNTRSVAELTLAEVISLSRRLHPQSLNMHNGVWDKSAAGAHEVRGRTLGIVGYGHIGSQVSVLAEAFGMRVLYYDIIPKLALGNARPVKDLNSLLKEADALTLHVPSTPSTRNMIGAAQLKKMKPGAFLLNNARGSVVDIPALAEALKSGHLAGAALDVFPHEPASKDEAFASELRGIPNVILTPHVGGSTEEAQAAIAEDVAAKFIKFMNVGSTTGAVNVPEVELPEQDAWGTGSTQRRQRILHFHRNVPGVLSKLHGVVAGLGANIWAEYLRTNEQIGYVVLDVDPLPNSALIDQLRAMPETIRVRELY
jgi:D-3-phosphoglycerate dehydrogenase